MKTILRKKQNNTPDNTIIFELKEVTSQRMAGFVSIKKVTSTTQEIQISKIAVSPKHQGKRLGALLFNCARQYAQSEKKKQLTLEASSEVVPFYKHLGMKVVSDGGKNSLSKLQEEVLFKGSLASKQLDYLNLSIPKHNIYRTTPPKDFN